MRCYVAPKISCQSVLLAVLTVNWTISQKSLQIQDVQGIAYRRDFVVEDLGKQDFFEHAV